MSNSSFDITPNSEFSAQYDENYYSHHLGPDAYNRANPIWAEFFGHVAQAIVDELHPTTFLDAGCAIGFLVESLRNRGVDAKGFDISDFAVNSVPPELAPHVYVASLTDEIEGFYDVISCIEVLEHLPSELAIPAIENLCRHTDVILFSSTPDDYDEITHVNVQDGDYWASIFASQGFYRDFEDTVAAKLAPQAVLFRRRTIGIDEAVAGYERHLTHLLVANKSTLIQNHQDLQRLRSQLIRAQLDASLAHDQIRQLEHFRELDQNYRNTRLFRFTKPLRSIYSRLRQNAQEIDRDQSSVDQAYQAWIENYEPMVRQFVTSSSDALERRPRVSILMPTYNTPVQFLEAAVSSVERQSYENWELCIADDASSNEETLAFLRTLNGRDSRIKVAFRSSNGHIAVASNSAMELATGSWVALLDHDDTLPPHALAAMVLAASEHPEATLIYSDRDMFDAEIGRYQPYFKPDFDPELILALNYICHFQMMTKRVLEEVGGFRAELAGSQDWDLSLRVIAQSKPEQIVHVPLVLYHWRHHPGSVSASLDVKPYASGAAQRAVQDFLDSKDSLDTPVPIESGGWFHIVRPSSQIVQATTVLITGHTQDALTKARSIFETSVPEGVSVEELLFDVGEESNDSRLLNEAIARSRNEYICVVDSDLRPSSEGWFEELAATCGNSGIGVVGPSVLSRDRKHLHTGIVLGLEGSFAELYQGAPEDWAGAYGRLLVARNFSAVSNACMMIKKEAWSAVGGFNELDTPRRGSEVDFCLRVREVGYRTLWTPFARLATSSDYAPPILRDDRWTGVNDYLNERWADLMRRDPYFNPNLDLTAANDGFVPASPPRVVDLFRAGRVTEL
jgi:GT2 family glycosyltransferase/2-polyprenyl-3-methyl-5-hydroxy-6-metoxy-1,4-benzoquinol methylase